MWTKDALHELIASKLSGQQIIVVANREPYLHRFAGDAIECTRPASGMAAALDPVMRASGGTWVAHGSGDADRLTVDEHDHVAVPPRSPATCSAGSGSPSSRRKITITVWPMKGSGRFAISPSRGRLSWPANGKPIARSTPSSPTPWCKRREMTPTIVFIQDYHFGMLPKYLKERNPKLIVAAILAHTLAQPRNVPGLPLDRGASGGPAGKRSPWISTAVPLPELPDHRGPDDRGPYRSGNLRGDPGRKIDTRSPVSDQHRFRGPPGACGHPAVAVAMEQFRKQLQLSDKILGVGMERIDYTKGIPERIRAIDRFLEDNPTYRESLFLFRSVCRAGNSYPSTRPSTSKSTGLVEKLNWKWSSGRWRPLYYFKRNFNPVEMIALHRLSQFCVVSSLHDGMNLVAKEFVASRLDQEGVLLLSRFTGSSRELAERGAVQSVRNR